jgi:hypothetical protein
VQSASAAHHAAEYQQKALKQAGQTVQDTAKEVNTGIRDTTNQAIQPVLAAGESAATGVTDAYKAAQAGVRGAALDANGMLSPYMQAGTDATGRLSTLADTMGKGFTASDMVKYDPGYQFRLDQGQRAMQAKAQAMGVSSGTLKALANYNQNAAAGEYGAAFNRWGAQNAAQAGVLENLAGRGLTAAGQAGTNLTEAERYAGTAGMQGEEYAGNMRTNTQQYGSNAKINAEDLAARNTMNAGQYLANTQVGAGQAQAQGDMNAANAWNGMLGGIGQGVTDLIAGGLTGGAGGGFNWAGAFGGTAKPKSSGRQWQPGDEWNPGG